MADRGHVSIAEGSHEVKKNLLSLISRICEKSSAEVIVPEVKITDILDRFILWAGNLGAFHDPAKKLSLDYRLQDAPEVQEEIIDLISDLLEAIEDLGDIATGKRPNRSLEDASDPGDVGDKLDELTRHVQEDLNFDQGASVGEGTDDVEKHEPQSEAEMILEVMLQCLRSLFRIAVLVRKSNAPGRDRFQRALQQTNLAFPESFDVDYVTNKYKKLAQPDTEWLGKRLGNAIAKRRQFIKYCRDHQARLAVDDTDIVVEVDAAATERLSSKATTFFKRRYIDDKTLQAELDDEDDDAGSLMTAVTSFDSDNMLRLPRLADLSTNGQPFECPICFTFQNFHHEKAWKSHAFRDLKPYVCTVGGADCKSELFGDRETWFEHELRKHRSQYVCPLCSDTSYNTRSRMAQHIGQAHGSFGEKQLDLLLEQARQAPAQFRAEDCPFCDDWARTLRDRADTKGKAAVRNSFDGSATPAFVSAVRFKRHVATHQEQLAIFAVPRSSDQRELNASDYAESDLSDRSNIEEVVNTDNISDKDSINSLDRWQEASPHEADDPELVSLRGSRGVETPQEDISSGLGTEDLDDTYPKKGKTRIPQRLISTRAIRDLGYDYTEEGDTIVISLALGKKNIDDLFRLSEEYRESEKPKNPPKTRYQIIAEIEKLERKLEQRRRELMEAQNATTEETDQGGSDIISNLSYEPLLLEEIPRGIININVEAESEDSSFSSAEGTETFTRATLSDRAARSAGAEETARPEEGEENKNEDLWTEISKDIVTAEAIKEKGYEYEETDQFFYVMTYLRYEDTLALVERTSELRRRAKLMDHLQREKDIGIGSRTEDVRMDMPNSLAQTHNRWDVFERELPPRDIGQGHNSARRRRMSA